MIKRRQNCRGCFNKKLHKFLDLGIMPLAGGFLTKKEAQTEKKFSLKVYYCSQCQLVQILDIIDPSVLFKHYYYQSSVIPSLAQHFVDYAAFLKKHYLKSNHSKLLEFGCNDGVLLQNFINDCQIDAYGIDPSDNISRLAKKKGVSIWTDYFNQKRAKMIKNKVGYFDVITGSNVFAHVDDIHEIVDAAKLLLKPDGVFIVEVHYLKVLLDEFQYDAIYHEHLCYYSVTALKNIFTLKNLKIIDVVPLAMHGGGIRVIATFENSKRMINSRVSDFLQSEKNINLTRLRRFQKNAIKHRKKLINLLKNIKRQGKTIVGYGAPGRGTILLNYCGIGKKYLNYIVDVSSLRAGKLMPGVHISIYQPTVARQYPPDYFLVLAWNYIDSIRAQEKVLVKKGVKFIIPFPEIKII